MSLFEKFTISLPLFRIHPNPPIWFSLRSITIWIIKKLRMLLLQSLFDYYSYSCCLRHLLSSCKNWGLHWSKINVIKLLTGSPILGRDNVIVLTTILKVLTLTCNMESYIQRMRVQLHNPLNTWLGLHSNWNEANATYVYGERKTFRWAKMRSGLSKNTMTKKYFKNWELFK